MATPVQPFSPDDLKRRRRRSIALGLALLALAAIFFVSTLVRLGGNVAERAL
ncbi:MAG: hypothetical protein GYA66_15905 [Phyllobacteriaceae bacterium]|jgi:hypothetical protein|nr:hypothetical protein [Phyllobacteriaceae bacterium]